MSFKYGKNPFATTKNRHSIFYPDNLYETVKNKLDVCFFHPNAKINEMVHTNTEMTYIYSVNGIYVTQGDVVYQITYNDDLTYKCLLYIQPCMH